MQSSCSFHPKPFKRTLSSYSCYSMTASSRKTIQQLLFRIFPWHQRYTTFPCYSLESPLVILFPEDFTDDHQRTKAEALKVLLYSLCFLCIIWLQVLFCFFGPFPFTRNFKGDWVACFDMWFCGTVWVYHISKNRERVVKNHLVYVHPTN